MLIFEKLVDFAEKNFGDKRGKVPNIKFSPKNGTRINTEEGIDQANLVFALISSNK
jgi:hypothetical protein